MNFFEQQRVAKKQTVELTIHFIIAVIFIIIVTNFLLFAVFKFFFDESNFFESNKQGLFTFFTIFQLALIFGGIAYKILQLQDGGKAIARLLGGFPLEKTTRELNQQKIVNVVDEIAVASGVVSPPIYLLESELSINALVAGFDSNNAVIAITEGAIRHLNRDELQAMVAHEFSHIFNGDMRFNTYLIGVLHGIQMISSFGSGLMHMDFGNQRRAKYYGDEDEGHFLGKSWAIGVCLYVIGYLGLILARAIKKEINIQREFLADATAVQYTRNGGAVSSVLKKILANKKNQFFRCGQQDIISHMCFTEVTFRGKSEGPGSHPEIEERILRIQKEFDLNSFTKFEANSLLEKINASNNNRMPLHKSLRKEILDELEVTDVNNSLSIGASIIMGLQASSLIDQSGVKAKLKDSLGSFNSDSLQYAKEQIKLIPSELIESVHNPKTSKLVILALFAHISKAELKSDSKKESMLSLLQKSIEKLPRALYLPLIEISLSSLGELKREERIKILKELKELIKEDKKINMQEFLYFTIINKHLSQKSTLRRKNLKLKDLVGEVSVTLSLIAHAGFPSDPEGAQLALTKVADQYFQKNILLVRVEDLKISKLNEYFSSLSKLSLKDKEVFLKASIDAAKFGGLVLPLELEIIRTLSSVLDVPLPLVI